MKGRKNTKKEKTKKSENKQKGERKPEPEPERKNKENKEKEESEGAAETRTPVRERIRRLNMRATASPGKFPLVKQQMIEEYFKKKSPKANKNRSQEKPDSQHVTNKQGARDSPLEGEPDPRRFCPDQAGSRTLPSRDPGPSTAERGRSWRNEAQKRAIKALERWPPDSSQGTKSPNRGRTVKRL